MSWRVDVEARGADDTLTVAQAASLKAAVVTALAGVSHTLAVFTSDQLPGVSGHLEPPMPASIARQAVADGTHTAVRN